MSGSFNISNKTYINKLKVENKIIMYAGIVPPEGYVWCDGNNNTPNLKNRFIYGIDNNVSVGDFGDNTINELPSHSHTLYNAGSNILNSYTQQDNQLTRSFYSTGSTAFNFQIPTGIGFRANGGNHKRGNNDGNAAHKNNHSHNLDNNTATPYLESLDVKNNYDNASINIRNININGSISNVTNSSNTSVDYEQKYILIGFIMKSTS